VIPNVFEIIEDFKVLGEGLDIKVILQNTSKSKMPIIKIE
jgi:hypothetical protein